MSGNLLIWIIFSPLAGAFALLFVPKNKERLIKLLGIIATLPALLLSIWIMLQKQSGFNIDKLDASFRWFGLGNFFQDRNMYAVHFEVGIDGLSLVMLLLAAILSTLAAIASWRIGKEWKGYFLLFLLLEVGMLGVFAAENLILFFLFFELTLVPLFFLIGKWGYADKERAAYRFLLYNGFGSAILLIVIMVLFAKTGTSNIDVLQQIIPNGGVQLMSTISDDLKLGLLLGLLVAFGVKVPIFPLHNWMLKVHVEAPPAIVMLHAGVLLKIGVFGLIKFGVGIFPEQFHAISFFVILLGLVNVLYGALLALIQDDFKMVLAYSSISHMGIVLLGLGAMNEAGIQGAIFQSVSHGLIAALLFFLVGVTYNRFGTTKLSELGGTAKWLPVYSGFLLAAGMASLGLPGMSGFISEFMAFLGLFQKEPVLAGIGAIGLILTAAYMLRAVLAITFGGAKEMPVKKQDLHGIEWLPAMTLLGLAILIGVFPSILADPLSETVRQILLGMGVSNG
ncbi:MAG: NuoM family protein [Bacillus sp. (in: firmicutes)]